MCRIIVCYIVWESRLSEVKWWVNGIKSVRGKRRENWDCVKLVWAMQVPCAKNYDLMYVWTWCIVMNFLSWIKSTFDSQLFHLFIFVCSFYSYFKFKIYSHGWNVMMVHDGVWKMAKKLLMKENDVWNLYVCVWWPCKDVVLTSLVN